MTPASFIQMLSGVRSTLYSLTGLDLAPWAQSIITMLPWEVYPSRQVKRFSRFSASIALTGFVIEDVTCAFLADQIGYPLVATNSKALAMAHSTSEAATLEWVGSDGTSPSDAFIRVKDNTHEGGVSKILTGLKAASIHAANLGDTAQAEAAEQMLSLITSSIGSLKRGSLALPAAAHRPIDAMIPFV